MRAHSAFAIVIVAASKRREFLRPIRRILPLAEEISLLGTTRVHAVTNQSLIRSSIREPNGMNTVSRTNGRSGEIFTHDQVRVTVVLAGKKNYHANFLPVETVYQVKVQALHHFKIPLAAVAQYALRYQGGDRPEGVRLARLGQNELHFTLVAKEAASRFGETLFLR